MKAGGNLRRSAAMGPYAPFADAQVGGRGTLRRVPMRSRAVGAATEGSGFAVFEELFELAGELVAGGECRRSGIGHSVAV